MDLKLARRVPGAPHIRDFRMCGRQELMQSRKLEYRSIEFPLIPKPGMSGAPGEQYYGTAEAVPLQPPFLQDPSHNPRFFPYNVLCV